MEFTKPTHPANVVYDAVSDKIVGAFSACADLFGATEGVAASGVALVREKLIRGAEEILDLSWYLADAYRLITF
ncbi:MAG: hypothetical protein R3C13_11820 [Hyphomonas sp.]|uniref:hypothetical protein n=1 Tax=Hyphomonas sp. TaxID=87 RepID=UPI0035274C01